MEFSGLLWNYVNSIQLDWDWSFGWIYVCVDVEIDRFMIAVVLVSVQQTGGKSVNQFSSSVVKGYINHIHTSTVIPMNRLIMFSRGWMKPHLQILRFSLGLDQSPKNLQKIYSNYWCFQNFSSKTASTIPAPGPHHSPPALLRARVWRSPSKRR